MAQPTAIVPDKGIRPGYNETGTIIAKSILVKKVAGTDDDSVAVAGDGENVFGATMQAIGLLARGDVQVDGQAIVTAGAAVAAGAEVTANSAGRAITAVSGDYICGLASTAAAADGDAIEVELVGPASGRIKA